MSPFQLYKSGNDLSVYIINSFNWNFIITNLLNT